MTNTTITNIKKEKEPKEIILDLRISIKKEKSDITWTQYIKDTRELKKKTNNSSIYCILEALANEIGKAKQ